MEKRQSNQAVDHIFLTILDLQAVKNIFVTANPATQTLLSSVLGVRFNQNIALRDGFIMRKELKPLLKAKLEELLEIY